MVIGFIGLGNMASAMVRGIAAAQLEGVALCGHNPHPEKAKALAEICGLRLCASNREVLERSDVVVLAVKPQILEGVLEEIAPLAAGKLFLSVAAGKELAWLSARLGHGCIVRAMPNINAVVGASVTGWCAGEQGTEEQKAPHRPIHTSISTHWRRRRCRPVCPRAWRWRSPRPWRRAAAAWYVCPVSTRGR